MGLDINTKKLKKNAFRVSKQRGIGASRIRVPGGYLNAEVLGMVQEIAQTYGNGYVHLTTRQGFEIEGIRFEDMDEINKKLQPIIEMLDINQEKPGCGYPASGTRNISACIGNNVCPFANYNTAEKEGCEAMGFEMLTDMFAQPEEFDLLPYSALWAYQQPQELAEKQTILDEIAWPGLVKCVTGTEDEFDANWESMVQELTDNGLADAEEAMTEFLATKLVDVE